MKLPRDLSGDDMSKALARIGYRETRQTGSHVRLTSLEVREHRPCATRPAIQSQPGRKGPGNCAGDIEPGGLCGLRPDAGGGVSGRKTRHSCGARDRAAVIARQTVARPAPGRGEDSPVEAAAVPSRRTGLMGRPEAGVPGRWIIPCRLAFTLSLRERHSAAINHRGGLGRWWRNLRALQKLPTKIVLTVNSKGGYATNACRKARATRSPAQNGSAD